MRIASQTTVKVVHLLWDLQHRELWKLCNSYAECIRESCESWINSYANCITVTAWELSQLEQKQLRLESTGEVLQVQATAKRKASAFFPTHLQLVLQGNKVPLQCCFLHSSLVAAFHNPANFFFIQSSSIQVESLDVLCLEARRRGSVTTCQTKWNFGRIRHTFGWWWARKMYSFIKADPNTSTLATSGSVMKLSALQSISMNALAHQMQDFTVWQEAGGAFSARAACSHCRITKLSYPFACNSSENKKR